MAIEWLLLDHLVSANPSVYQSKHGLRTRVAYLSSSGGFLFLLDKKLHVLAKTENTMPGWRHTWIRPLAAICTYEMLFLRVLSQNLQGQ